MQIFLCEHFERIGIGSRSMSVGCRGSTDVRIDIGRESDGEFFEIGVRPWTLRRDLTVLDARPQLRHLLLMSRTGDEKRSSSSAATMSGTGSSRRLPGRRLHPTVQTAIEASSRIAVRRAAGPAQGEVRKRATAVATKLTSARVSGSSCRWPVSSSMRS